MTDPQNAGRPSGTATIEVPSGVMSSLAECRTLTKQLVEKSRAIVTAHGVPEITGADWSFWTNTLARIDTLITQAYSQFESGSMQPPRT